MMNKILIPALIAGVISACGGSNSSTDSNGDGQGINEDSSVAVDHTVLLKENQALTAPRTSLSTDLNDPAYVLQLQSNGFPNLINQITLSDGQVIKDTDEIKELFVLFVDPKTGEVEIKVNKNFDYEQSSSSYQLDVSLGTETLKILVKLFDIQTGTEQEALKINSYNELKSFFNGQFVSDNIGNDVIELDNPNSDSHHLDNLYIQLEEDIDASASATTPWIESELHGYLNGAGYVINQLSIETGQSFIRNSNRFRIARVSNIGFVDTQFSSTLISSSSYSSRLSSVFVSGDVTSTNSAAFYFSPFRVAGEFSKVFTNLRIDLTSLNTQVSNARTEVGAFLGSASAPINFRSGYSNGSIHMDKNVKTNAQINGFSAGLADLSDFGYSLLEDSLFYSAIDFEVSENQELYGNRAYIQTGGLANSYINYPPFTAEDSDYNWRFVTDRNATGRLQTVGNSHRDLNNDGQADAAGVGPDMSAAGITTAQAKSSATFTGKWIDEDSVFNISVGEFPVLKGMPYPHTQGALWMKAEFASDPGIAYQRATYNDYLSAP